ncbi:hypothetical protein JCM3765_002734 [Sporobolomyces pararoseus]
MDSSLLYFTLVFALISLLCATYTTLRTLLPLVPGHPLNRRQQLSCTTSIVHPEPSKHKDKDTRPRLKSAQRFTAYLALNDVFATCVLLWEVASVVSLDQDRLGYSKLSDSRIYLATTARPTILSIVAVLSYTNVIRGRSISLGFADCIVWGPALFLYIVGAGLASLATVNGSVWTGLLIWLSTTTFIVTLCFSRLLMAILRVRSMTRKEQTFSPWSREQDKVLQAATDDLPYQQRYSLTFHPNFSNLSTNFVRTIGRSSRAAPQDNLGSRPSFGSDPFRRSRDVGEESNVGRDFRSPTPGSTQGLLDRSNMTTPASSFSQSTARNSQVDDGQEHEDHEEIIEIHSSRNSFGGESIASRASPYLGGGGFVGNSAARKAIIREAWRDQDPPGTGHSSKVELSEKEARGAIIRLGGHLLSSLLGFTLAAPFVCDRISKASSSIPLAASFLLVLGVCQPSIVLATQCWMSEGFWFRQPTPPILTSSTATDFETVEVVSEEGISHRATSRASMWKDALPGIRLDGEDCDADRKSRVGRALSILSAHPKLQLLSTDTDNAPSPFASTSGFVKSATTSGHARLRSLKLSKGTIASMGEWKPSRARANSSASRRTVGGFEHGRTNSAPTDAFDTAIAMHLLASRPKTPDPAFDPVSSVSMATLSERKRALSSSPTPSPLPDSYHFDFSYREVSISPSSPSDAVSNDPRKSTRPISIDFLSSQLLPRLVPSLRLGLSLPVDPSSEPIPSPPPVSNTINSTRRSRNVRSLSLPLLHSTFSPPTFRRGVQVDTEVWIAVDDDKKSSEEGEEDVSRLELSPQVEPIPHSVLADQEQSTSSSTRLDISFDWEAVDETEALDRDEVTFGDESSAGDDQEAEGNGGANRRRLRRSRVSIAQAFSFPPVPPLSIYRRPSPQAQSVSPSNESQESLEREEDEDEDVHTSTFHCATVRPVVRVHDQTGSIGSTRSFGELNQSSITSEGFKNLLSSAGSSWHASTPSADPEAKPHRLQTSLSRRPLPTPPLQPGHRPLSLLSQRDTNQTLKLEAESETELQKTTRYSAARKAKTAFHSNSQRPNIPLPPIPNTISEVEEDRKSGTPTPKSRRTLKDASTQKSNSTRIPSHSTPIPSRTPPNVTSRSKLRSRHQRNASSMSVNDENVELPASFKTPERAGRSSRGPASGITRRMR